MTWQLPFLSSHAPVKQKGDSSTLSLFFNYKNLVVDKGLVKTSATWSIEGTKQISNVFFKTLLWTRIFHVRPHSIGETRFFICEKLILEKLESPPILFLF